MKYWLSLLFEPAEQLVDLARLAEDLGFEGVVLPDHVVIQVGDRTPHPVGFPLQAETEFLDPFCAFAAMAAVTTRLRFLNYIYVVPLRDPFLLAKQVASLALLSGNRFTLGTGVGWLQEEFETVGRAWSTRGRRMDEMLTIMQDFWDDGYAEFHGEFFDFPRSGMFPVPTAPVPLIIGGHSLRGARRAANYDGYILQRGIDDDTLREFAEIDTIRDAAGLTGPFERMIVWPGAGEPRSPEQLEDEVGLTGVIVMPWSLAGGPLSVRDKREAAVRFVAAHMTSVT